MWTSLFQKYLKLNGFFFGSFAYHFQIKFEHTWLKSQLHICNYEWAKNIFVDGGLKSKLQHFGPCKISWKKSKKLQIQIVSVSLKMTSCKTTNKKKVKKSKSQDFIGKTNFLTPSPWALGKCEPHGRM
jgi:hypothetical protein